MGDKLMRMARETIYPLRSAMGRQCERLGAASAFAHASHVLETSFSASLVPRDIGPKDGFFINLAKMNLGHVVTDAGALPREFLSGRSRRDRELADELVQAFEYAHVHSPFQPGNGERIDAFIAFLADTRIPQRVRALVIFHEMADGMVALDRRTAETLDALPKRNAAFPQYSDWEESVAGSAMLLRKVLVPFADRYGFTNAYRNLMAVTASVLYPEASAKVAAELRSFEESGAVGMTNRVVDMVLREAAEMAGLRIRKVSSVDGMDSLREGEIGVSERRSKSLGTLTDKVVRTGKEVREVHDVVARFVIAHGEDGVHRMNECIREALFRVMVAVPMPDMKITATDYYARPKPNGYRSINMDVVHLSEKLLNFEIIMRTVKDHIECDRGGAAHNKYKNGGVDGSAIESIVEVAAAIKARNGYH